MGSIRATPGIRRLALQLVVDCLQKVCGYDSVGVENDDILALGALHTIVTALPRAAILLEVIMQIKDVCVLVANILAGNL